MILDSTKIAGDLKVAKGGHIYASGTVTVPPLAILEDSAIASNETVLFSAGDTTPGTIKTSGTVIADGTIVVPKESVVRAAAEFRISASKLTTTTVINTQLAEGTAVTTCKKLDSAAPEWSSTDIYSTTQPRSNYSEASRSIDLVYPNEFVTPAASALKKVTEYRLITDHTFSPNC